MTLPETKQFAILTDWLLTADASDLLAAAPKLGALIPELGATVGFDQRSPHHAYDIFTHTAHVVAAVPADPVLRWAALLHDVGKVPTFTRDATGRGHFYGHAGAGADMADAILRRLEAPDGLREQAVSLIRNHMTKLQPDKQLLRRWCEEFGDDTLCRLLLLQEADMGSKGLGRPKEMAQFARIRSVLMQIQEEASEKIT